MDRNDVTVPAHQIVAPATVIQAWEMQLLPVYYNFDRLTWDVIGDQKGRHEPGISSLPLIPTCWHAYVNRIMQTQSISLLQFHHSQCTISENDMGDCYWILKEAIDQEDSNSSDDQSRDYMAALLMGASRRWKLLRDLVKAIEDVLEQYLNKPVYSIAPVEHDSQAQGMCRASTRRIREFADFRRGWTP